MRDEKSWIRTYSGVKFYPLDPEASDLIIEDIAHALANTCRFTGHVRYFYSVAQHSVLVSQYLNQLSPLAAMTGLLHDGSEAYLCDFARPIKTQPAMAPYREADDRLQRLIYSAFGVDPDPGDWLHKADMALFYAEWRDLMTGTPGYELPPIIHPTIAPWTPAYAKEQFLMRYDDLLVKLVID